MKIHIKGKFKLGKQITKEHSAIWESVVVDNRANPPQVNLRKRIIKTRNLTKCFLHNILLDPHNNPMGFVLLLTSFYTWGNWWLKRLNHLSMVTPLTYVRFNEADTL